MNPTGLQSPPWLNSRPRKTRPGMFALDGFFVLIFLDLRHLELRQKVFDWTIGLAYFRNKGRRARALESNRDAENEKPNGPIEVNPVFC
jgi:hypothetical protein